MLTYSMPRPAYKTLGDAIGTVMDHGGVTTVALADQLRDRGWKVDQSRMSKWRNGHERPHDIDIFPDIEAICGVPKGTILRLAGYVDDGYPDDIDRTDDDERALWDLRHIPEATRRELIKQLRAINAEPPPPPTRKKAPPRRREPGEGGGRRPGDGRSGFDRDRGGAEGVVDDGHRCVLRPCRPARHERGERDQCFVREMNDVGRHVAGTCLRGACPRYQGHRGGHLERRSAPGGLRFDDSPVRVNRSGEPCECVDPSGIVRHGRTVK